MIRELVVGRARLVTICEVLVGKSSSRMPGGSQHPQSFEGRTVESRTHRPSPLQDYRKEQHEFGTLVRCR